MNVHDNSNILHMKLRAISRLALSLSYRKRSDRHLPDIDRDTYRILCGCEDVKPHCIYDCCASSIYGLHGERSAQDGPTRSTLADSK